MIDRRFGHGESGHLEQGREKTVSIAEEMDSVQTLPAKDPQRTADIGNAIVQKSRPDPIGDPA